MRSALGGISGIAAIALASVVTIAGWDARPANARDAAPATALTSSAEPAAVTTDASQDAPVFSKNPNYKHAWIDVDGVKTHYIEAGSGPPFVLIHGALSWESGEVNYSDVMGPLSKNFRVIAPDMIGSGYTKPRGPQDFTGQAQGEFLIHFLEAMKLGPMFIAGGSHGGFLTQFVAHERPALIRKLVISNSLNGTSTNRPPMTDRDREPLPPQTKAQVRQMLEQYYKHKDLVTEERVRLVHDVYQRNYEYSSAKSKAIAYSVDRYNENLSYKGKHISAWGGQLKMPLLLMWSEPGSRIDWGLEHMKRVPGSEMHILPWSGHHLPTDQSARWVHIVTDWLLSDPPRPPN